MATLYLRSEPTSDNLLSDEMRRLRRDVVAYRDRSASEPVALWHWHFVKSKPRKGCREVIVNGTTYRAEWLADL